MPKAWQRIKTKNVASEKKKHAVALIFHNAAMNSFYSRKSAAPDICKYIFTLA